MTQTRLEQIVERELAGNSFEIWVIERGNDRMVAKVGSQSYAVGHAKWWAQEHPELDAVVVFDRGTGTRTRIK